ncbi:MAG: hypothetical protein BWY50_00442 [Spirochaetes bacterium ADurb.Bin315]|nr:CdaR family protein [Spirochaetota bacterium]NLL25187.1 YbbR-like domain-containing protein [Spirochaetales bacterium]OQA44678.1 MAG: hypothetical protein BWY50_00442 [Spirochaetes bacterium ADurb.Bin315]TAH57196.1 MAG: YbbR-like domain-containing protein [Sphaerochaeta sp.]HOE89534.1 CdaR family protein [Sphaerochaeta sp.]
MKRLNKYLQGFLVNWPAKVLSLLLAVAVYAFIHYSTIGARSVTIPITVLLPERMEAQSLVPDSIDVEIRGDEHIIYLINPDSITAVVDFSKVEKEGITTANVILTHDREVFERSEITLKASPSSVRVLFGPRSGP